MTKVILHISGDYPDHFQPAKTKAVSSLVNAVGNCFDQIVFSLNRTTPSLRETARKIVRNPLNPDFDTVFEDESSVIAVKYDGLSSGLFMDSALKRLAEKIADHAMRLGIKPDLVHGHKLTIEGLIAEKLSAHFDCPYALSVQVNTDRKILKYRPDLRRTYRRIYHGAAIVFPFSVMGQRVCDAELGPRTAPTIVLPCTSSEDRIIAPQMVEPVLASVFHLRDYRNKNVASLVNASASLQQRHEGYAFHLYGGGSPGEEKEIDALISRSGAHSFFRKGKIAHNEVQQMLNTVCGFAMVSKRETFGMVFLEALLAGCPVVFPKDWAIDGFFDEASFALGASANDPGSIEAAMEKLIVDQASMKRELAQWQESGKLSCFQRANVVNTYRDAVSKMLSSS